MIKINLEELIAGAILKFRVLDSLDMTLLITKLAGIAEVNQKISELSKYIQYSGGYIHIKPNLSLDSNISLDENKYYSLKQLLENKQKGFVKEYLDELNLTTFVLKKIKMLSIVKKDDLSKLFNKVELSVIYQLIDLGYLIVSWNDEVPYEDYQEVLIAKQGEIELFLEDNAQDVSKFISFLNEKGYDVSLIRDFLSTIPDLEQYCLNENSISHFEYFCSLYDRCALK